MDKDKNEILNHTEQKLSPEKKDSDIKINEETNKQQIVSKIKQAKQEATADNIVVNNRRNANFDTSSIKNTRAKNDLDNLTLSNKRNQTATDNIDLDLNTTRNAKQKETQHENDFDISKIINTRTNNTSSPTDKNIDTSLVKNTRLQKEFDYSNIVNTRNKTSNAEFNTNNVKNTRSQQTNLSSLNETKSKQTNKTNDQFIDLVNETLHKQNENKTVFNFEDFNIPQFDFSSFTFQPNKNIIPQAEEKQIKKPPLPSRLQNKQGKQEVNEATQEAINSSPKDNISEKEISDTQNNKYVSPDIEISLTEEQDSNTGFKKENIIKPQPNEPEVLEIEEVPETPEISTNPTNNESNSLNKNSSLNELFGLDNNANKSTKEETLDYTSAMPEYAQQDILSLVDISLNNNVAELLASQNASELSGVLDGVAEDLVVTKVRRSRKLWILLLVFLLGITVLFACCYDYWFGKTPNEEEAKGLTINIIPSKGNAGELDAQYIFFPGSTIFFKDGVRIGSERFRYEEQPDGSLKQYENNAFAFRFRFYVEFIDEGNEGNRPEHNEIISHVIEPDVTDDKIKLSPDETGKEANNIYSYDGSWFYYFGIIYPGEKYISFCEGVSLYQNITNEYQGRNFKIVMEYETIVPSGTISDVISEMPDAPTSWASQITSEYSAYYA